MKKLHAIWISAVLIILVSGKIYAERVIYINQLAYRITANKIAVIGYEGKPDIKIPFEVIDVVTGRAAFISWLSGEEKVEHRKLTQPFYKADFSACHQRSMVKIQLILNNKTWFSEVFEWKNPVAKGLVEKIKATPDVYTD